MQKLTRQVECSQEVDILVSGCHDDIFGLHKETRKPVVSTALLFENMELSYSLYVPDLSQKFWVENILFLASFKRELKNTCMCLESVTTFASDKMGTKTKPLITKWKLISRLKNFFKKHITHSCMWNCTFVNLEHIGSCWTLNLVIKWNCSFLPDNSGYAHKDLRSRHLNIPVIIIKNLLYIRSGDKNESLNVNSILMDSLKNNKNLKCYLNNGCSTLFSKFTPSISFSYKNYISEIALA